MADFQCCDVNICQIHSNMSNKRLLHYTKLARVPHCHIPVPPLTSLNYGTLILCPKATTYEAHEYKFATLALCLSLSSYIGGAVSNKSLDGCRFDPCMGLRKSFLCIEPLIILHLCATPDPKIGKM